MCNNVDLEVRILKSGKRKYQIAQALHWHPSKLSSILNRVYTPSTMEMEDLADELGCQVADIFPSGRGVVA